MGNKEAKSKQKESPTKKRAQSASAKPALASPSEKFQTIANKFDTLDEVQEGLRQCGLESSNLIIGVDFTGSNENSGKKTFGGKSLHTIDDQILNPYQEVIEIVGKTLEVFDDDKLIPVFGFGDASTSNKSVFSFKTDGSPCHGFQEVLSEYTRVTKNVKLAGPTSFAALIRKAIQIVKESSGYHILIIIADGQISEECQKETSNAIVDASEYPISIITVGVGDGPWHQMEEYDDKLPKRKFDNFQFVPFAETMEKAENREVKFSIAALQEIPDQYQTIKHLNYL
jgi:hypothetical protein